MGNQNRELINATQGDLDNSLSHSVGPSSSPNGNVKDIARIMREAFGSCLIELACPSCGVRLIHYDFSGPNVSCSECRAHGSVGSFHAAMVKHGVASSLELTAKWSKDFEVLNEIAVALRAPDRFDEAFRPLYGKSTDAGRPSRKANLDGPEPS
jgi:hypothetical protein